MKTSSLFAVATLLLLSACSPKVITKIVKTYPESVYADSVHVIEPGEVISHAGDTIGHVSVVDRGFTTKCQYDYVLRLAQEATAKNGGNGLAIIDHRKPSVWSSCHQISGLMLYLSDREVDTLKVNAGQMMGEITPLDPIKRLFEYRVPANSFEASIGYGWITSKLYDVDGRELDSKGGMEWKLAYRHLWKNGWGAGLLYSGYKKSFVGGDINLSYIAPECSWGARSKKWILRGGIGAGLFVYHEPGYSVSSLGIHVSFNVEYMVADHWGLGFSANTVSASLPKQDNVVLKDNERNGIARLNILGGVHYYF